MFALHIKQAFRTLSRQKVFTCINVLGLALSLACCIVLTRYLHREFTIDANAIEPETLCELVAQENNYRPSDEHAPFDNVLGASVVDKCRYCLFQNKCDITCDSVSTFANLLLVDANYLNFFDLKVTGDRDALSHADAVLISSDYAKRMIDGDPLGKTLTISNLTFTVAGVFEVPACKRRFDADIIAPYIEDHYGIFNGTTFIASWYRLSSVAEIDRVNTMLRNHKESWRNSYRMMTLHDGYLKCPIPQARTYATLDECNPTALRILLGVDVLILLVGLFNFVNIYMVLMQRRRKEWGVRKVFGQKHWNLFCQVWTENILQVLAALFVAWLVVEISKPYVDQLMEEAFGYSWFDLHLTLAVLIVVPLIAAVYPFVQYLLQPPVFTLKSTASGKESIRARLGFLSFQYLLTLCILICAVWYNQHLRMLQKRAGSIDVSGVIVANFSHYSNNNIDFSTFDLGAIYNSIEEIQHSPLVETYDFRNSSRVLNYDYSNPVSAIDHDGEVRAVQINCSGNIFRMFDLPFIETAFDVAEFDSIGPEPQDHYYFFLNETAFRQLGFKSLENAYIYNATQTADDYEVPLMSWSRSVRTDDGEDTYEDLSWGTRSHPAKVMGIVKDYYCTHASEGIRPMVFCCLMSEVGGIYIGAPYMLRPVPGKADELISFLESLQQKYYGTSDLDWHWYQQEVDDLYQDDRRLSHICTLFATIAILICCLGLLGLSLFDIRQRYREIAIRKAHGAHRKDLYLLLGKKYFYLLLVTFLLSIPVTYLLIHRYTESFIESAPLTPAIYIEALGIVVLITLLTLIYQLEKAARVNVASVVKTE